MHKRGYALICKGKHTGCFLGGKEEHSLASELESFLVQGSVQIFPHVGLSPDITLTTCGNINTNKNNFQMRDVCNVFFYWHLCLLIWLKLTINSAYCNRIAGGC